ncbi:MAG: transposase, partial [Hyphomicrobiales bacterium]|nr:transposase [Hyphomicrobiales bacterium]
IAETIRAKLARASPRLLTFIDYPGEVEVTNNACERALRPAVIQRKVTNGFRSMWQLKAIARSEPWLTPANSPANPRFRRF